MNITFLGLGIMGSRMATNLLKKGTALTVWNRSAAAAAPLAALGARVAASAAEAVAEADWVISMLATPEAVAEVFWGPQGVLSQLPEGSLWMDCSTVHPSFSRAAAARARAAGLRFMDAPVAGSAPQAEQGVLRFLVGAAAEDLAPYQPYLEQMGTKVLPLGQVGQGAAFKMLVNALLGQSMLLFAEAVTLGEKMGFETSLLLPALAGTPVMAPFVQGKLAMLESGVYPAQFPLELLYKDLHLAAVTAYEHQHAMPLVNVTKERYAEAVAAGYGRADFSAIYQHLKGDG